MVVTLKESCLRILTAHSGGLFEVGNCPYRLIRPVLLACQPDQLAHIEDQSPHLMLDSDEIWALLLARDFPSETVLPPNERDPSPSPSSAEEDFRPQEVDLSPNRVKYFDVRAAKEHALASASARLRERTQANRSDQGKRKAIFTGQTDYGIGSKKRKLTGPKAWGSHTAAAKSLAEKARQQVKKSAAVYATAARAKPVPPPTVSSGPRIPASMSGRAAPATPIFSIRRPHGKDPTPMCVVRAPAKPLVKVVQVSAPCQSSVAKPSIAPAPFPKPVPKRQAPTGPMTTALKRTPLPSFHPSAPPPMVALLQSKAAGAAGPVKQLPKKATSLFMPKAKRPPPLPTKSLVSMAGSSNARGSQR